MRIDVISDTICPWCFIGKRRLEEALSARPGLDVEIVWRPYELNPDMPAQGMDRREYMAMKFGGAEGAAKAYEPVRVAGQSVGISFAFEKMEKVPSTIKSHCLIHWAGEGDQQDRMVEALFRAYFLEGRDIGDDDTLVAIAREVGLDGDEIGRKLAAGDDLNLIRTRAQVARSSGVTGVPCFIVDKKYAVVGAQDAAVFVDLFDKLASQETKAE
ncbi:MAG: DsbA family oxidoreductase [Alphaproteobacteria bacterium]|nr:MAG: DsbA family oxidoreductase [Alphaproteobacteria bacterium]